MERINEKIKSTINLGGESFEYQYQETIQEAANAIEKLFIEEQIKLLDDVFGDGLGNIDDNCSKDDLIEQYQSAKTQLTQKLKLNNQ